MFSLLFYPAAFGQEELEESCEYLLFESMPLVITASKEKQKINMASSVMTVITENEILRSGCRTVYELLKRVPGFFPTMQATWPLVGSRGLVSDGNDHILFLIDGHVQNSVIGQGYQQQDLIPCLEKVKLIEIIRGPGSVLWGSSAVMGVINIITKDGTSGSMKEGYADSISKSTVGYGEEDGMVNVNHFYVKSEGDLSILSSFSYWESEGYDRPDKKGFGEAYTREAANEIKGNVEFPWGEIGSWPPIDKHHEGYEFYAKIRYDNHVILGRVVETNLVYPWDSWLEKLGSDLFMRKAYVEYQHQTRFSDFFSLDSVFYGDILLQNRFPSSNLFKPSEDMEIIQDQSNEELAFGAEFTGNLTFSDQNSLKIGLKGVRTKIGPNRDARFNSSENRPSDLKYPYIGVESGYDNNLALYAEDMFNLREGRTSFFLGGRIDDNDFREDKTVFLPRAGIIQKLGDDFTLKYVMNTGYLRPNAVYSKTVGVIVDVTRGPTQDILRVDKSERIMSHDIQLYWEREKNYIALTPYYMTIEDYISFDANNVPQGYKNLGDAKTIGVELEGKFYLNDSLGFYANYSYSDAELKKSIHQGALTDENDKILNYPRHIFNVGTEWRFNDRNSLNVHLNGWMDMPIILPIGEAATYGEFSSIDSEYYLDMSFTANRIAGSNFNLTVFAFNLLDNTDSVGLVVNNGIWYPRGQDLGVKLSLYW